MKQIRSETGICHLRVTESAWLKAFLTQVDLAPLTTEACAFQVDEWMHWGCIYVDGVRTREDLRLEPGQIIRLHTRPKRYHWDNVPLKSRLVHEDEELLILDKPAGLPTHPTLDNFVENAKVLLERELGHTVYVTHRLDVATQGLLILAKTPPAQALVNKSFARSRVEKIYHAITDRPVPVGLHVHYINPETRAPREISPAFHPGWWECRLEIEACGLDRGGGFWHRIRLLTGKTHQIRAQLSALQAPVRGDKLYGYTMNDVPERLELECYQLSFPFRSGIISTQRQHTLIRPSSDESV